jgi:hypothetical protein
MPQIDNDYYFSKIFGLPGFQYKSIARWYIGMSMWRIDKIQLGL